MVELKHSDIRIIEEGFRADPGYVLNFSNRTFSEFFQDEFGIDIYGEEYGGEGTSKMSHLRAFVRISKAPLVCRVLRRLWEYREEINFRLPDAKTKERVFKLIIRLEGSTAIAATDAIDRFAADQTLDELVTSIERDISADHPVAALDRLHTYCAKKFGYLLDQRQITWDRAEPLHSRVGKYAKALQSDNSLSDMTVQIIKNANGVFDKFNHLRNNQSLAHDNELVTKAEARFIFDSVRALLRFIRTVDIIRFGS